MTPEDEEKRNISFAARRSNHVGRDEIASPVWDSGGHSLTADEGVRLMVLEGDLGKRMKGQPEVISVVVEAVRMGRARLKKVRGMVGNRVAFFEKCFPGKSISQ